MSGVDPVISTDPPFDFDHPPADPVALFGTWMADYKAAGLPNPTAMSLATVDADGRPSCRIVLMRAFDERGIVFFTNRESRKGAALASNSAATCVFHCDPIDRQIVITGDAAPVDDAESDAYFVSRGREKGIGAWASRQSRPCRDRAELMDAVAEIEKRFEGQDEIPRPPYWGGYRIAFRSIQFWQGHRYRWHDRIEYRADGAGGWAAERLFP